LRLSPILEKQRSQGIRFAEASDSKSRHVGGALAGSINSFFVRAYLRVEGNIAGSNWDYRLIFLIPTLPFAFILARQREYKYSSMAYIILVIFSENSMELRMRGGAILAHLASFLTFLFVLTILTQQSSRWDSANTQDRKPCCQIRNETCHGFAGAGGRGSSSFCEFPAYFSGVIWRRPGFSHAKFECCQPTFFGRSVTTCIF